MTNRARMTIQAIVLLYAGQASVASAYIDPNSGGLLYQLLLPFLVAALAFWGNVKRWIAAAWERVCERLRRDV